MKKPRTILTALVLTAGLGNAATISVDLNNTTDPNWTVNGAAGPLSTTVWNNTSTDMGGPSAALLDETGTPTSATMIWSSANTWTNGDNNGTQDHRLAHAYLDDGGSGVSVTINSIPYAQYRVYGLISSGQNGAAGTYTTVDFDVNGIFALDSIINGGGASGTTALAYGGATGALAATGSAWVEITGDGAGSQTQTGNYWVMGGSGATLTVQGQVRSGNDRGSLTAIIIEEVPEPSTTLLGGLAGLVLLIRRRR